MKNAFRKVGHLEGLSLLLLFFVAMPLKYWGGQPMGVKVVGLLHGLLFLLYMSLSLIVASDLKWPRGRVGLVFLAAVLPFGTFYFDRKYLADDRA